MPNKRYVLAGLLILGSAALSVSAALVGVVGGTATSPTDITAYLIANQDITLGGGNFVVRIPQTGAGITNASTVDPTFIRNGNNGFSATTNPAINYTGVISGNGTIQVSSAFNPTAPAFGQPFNGGALLFTGAAPQTWGVSGVASGLHNTPALTVDANVTIGFLDLGAAAGDAFPTSVTQSRNIVNNGYIYASRTNLWSSITGTGTNVFTYNGGQGKLRGPEGSVYSGQLFDFNSGTQIHWGAAPLFENQPNGQPTVIESSDITVFVTHNDQYLTDPATYKTGDPILTISPDIHMLALDHQYWNTGIVQFTGVMIPPVADKNHLELGSSSDAVQGEYYYGSVSNQGFGHTIYMVNRPTILMGDGREIIVNPDGVTNNTYLQGNLFNSNLSPNAFVSRDYGTHNGAMVYNYSGRYRVDNNMNAVITNGTIAGIHNRDWVNLLILDPTQSNPRRRSPTRPSSPRRSFLRA